MIPDTNEPTRTDSNDRPAGRPEPEYDVPSGETPAATGRHCDRPFRLERDFALHLGDAHEGALDRVEADRDAAAVGAERAEMFYYHAKVVGALGALYSILVIVYMIAFGSGII
jgi:hypothetical protein